MTREGALDAQLLAAISHLGRQKAQALHTDLVVFEPVEFANKLITFLGGEQLEEDGSSRKLTAEGWEKLGETVISAFIGLHLFISCKIENLFGTFIRGAVKKKARVIKVAPEKEAGSKSATVPTQVKTTREKKEATTAEVERIHTTLLTYYNEWNRQPICFFEFVINPHSFGQTIENIFYASFLVRDGHAEVFLDEDKLPVIEPVEHEDGDVPRDNLKRHQVVMSITYQEWLDIIKIFQIQEPLIPTRDPVGGGPNPDLPPDDPSEGSSGSSRSTPDPGPSSNGLAGNSDTENEGPAPAKRASKKKK